MIFIPVWGWKNWPLSPFPSASCQILQCNAHISGKCVLHAGVKSRVSWNVHCMSSPGELRGLEPILCAPGASHREGTALPLLLGAATGTAAPDQTQLGLGEIQIGKLFQSRMATQGAEKPFEWSHRTPSQDENYNGKRGTIKWDTRFCLLLKS